MQLYRLYRLSRSGAILDAEIVAADDDAGAIEGAKRLQRHDAVELWHLGRRVAVLNPRLAAAA